jgi:hypothetical protein
VNWALVSIGCCVLSLVLFAALLVLGSRQRSAEKNQGDKQ